MTCPFCHAENPPGSSACVSCGRSLHLRTGISGSADETMQGSDPDVTFVRSAPPGAPGVSPPASAPGAASAGSSREAAPGATNLLRPGTDLGARYHIQSVLGEGGMGSVYRAYDRELDRTVAIKVIRPGLMAEPSAVLRFKQELLLGSRISHRNILRIHDLGDVGGLKFISMACIDGQDLHTILQREGRLPMARAVSIALQVADALAAAHREGVIHRDLKPHNILLDAAGTPYVSDFGLAKSLQAGADGMTRSGELLGTPRYMAPEQVEGAGVDHRADLYALGLILYEMVTGTAPFHGHSAIQELLQRVRVKPPDPRTVNADVPASLATIILRCLERQPETRYQTADELGAALAGVDVDAGATASRRSSAATGWPALRSTSMGPGRRGALLGGFAVLLAVALGVGAWSVWLGREREPAAPTGGMAAGAPSGAARYVAVVPLRILGPEEPLRYVADGLAEALATKLFAFEQLRVVSPRDVEQAGTAFGSVEEAGRRLGANLIVDGSLQASGNRLRVIVNLHDVAAKRRVFSQEFVGAQDDLFTLEDRIHQQLVATLGVHAATGDLARAVSRPTDDLAAYDLYLKGRNALRQRQDPLQLKASIEFFERAIRQDHEFALAQAGLADASIAMYRETKDGFWAQRAQAAAERGSQLNDALPEVHYSLGTVYTATGRHKEAVVVLRQALELAPNSDEAHRRLGAAYRQLGMEQDAIRELERAADINPYFWVNLNALGSAYVRFGHPEKALEAFRRVTELEPDNPVGYENIGTTYYTQGRWEECIPAFQKALSLQEYYLTYSNLGAAFFYLKRYDEAVQAFEKAASLNPNDAMTAGNLADAQRWSGRRNRARETYARAIGLAFKDLQVNPRDAATLGVIALYYAKSGDGARAAEFVRRARETDPTDVALLYYEAVVLTLAGRQAPALGALEKALEGGYPAREAMADPELRPLADSAGWSRLLQKYQTQGRPQSATRSQP